MPRFIIFVRANAKTESELKPDPAALQAMSVYNDAMSEAGILLSADGLHPSRRYTKRIIFKDSGLTTIQAGPFPVNELIAGLWVIEVKDLDEAVAWAVKAPFEEGHISEVRMINDLKEDLDEGEGSKEEVK